MSEFEYIYKKEIAEYQRKIVELEETMREIGHLGCPVHRSFISMRLPEVPGGGGKVTWAIVITPIRQKKWWEFWK